MSEIIYCCDCGEPTTGSYICEDCLELDYIQNQDDEVVREGHYTIYDYWDFQCEGEDFIDEDRPY